VKKLKKIFLYTALSILLILAVLGIWSFLIEPDLLFVNHYELKVKNWSPKLNNFKIVAIADIHAGRNFIDEAKIRKIVELANAEDADIIVLLGDYVAQQHFDRTKLKMPVETVAENLKGLRAKFGVYAVLGNHDGWFNLQAVRQSLEKDGYKVLENEAVQIEKDGEKLRIVGLPDSLSGEITENNIQNAREGLARLGNEEGKVIVLTHNPDDIVKVINEALVSPDFVLFLAGHTHGGQVRLPFIGAPVVPSKYGQKYAAGHVRDKGVDMFVTTGVGTSIIPVRFGIPPEIAVLNIVAE
jgi:predicted MPP superfamily phosphohydrolase